MASGGVVPGLGPNTSTFLANMKQHLTKLTLWMRPQGEEVRYLDSLDMLKALKKLELRRDHPFLYDPEKIKLLVTLPPSHEIPGETLTLKLPDLAELDWHDIQPLQKELVLSCPKLAHADFVGIESIRIKVEHALLKCLTLAGRDTLFVVDHPEVQLQSLQSLNVDESSETGRHLMQDLDQRTNLKCLRYVDFPATCMPTSFPGSLQEIELSSLDWSQGLPKGLKELHSLKKFSFYSECKFWDNITLSNIKRPYADLLPFSNLDYLRLGFNCYERQPDGALQLSDVSELHDTPHGQYLAGLPIHQEAFALDFSLQHEKFKAIGKLRLNNNINQ